MAIHETRSKEDVVKQFREETLIDAARKLIAQEGVKGVTIERIAELANVSKGTIYLYYKNKEDLIQATITKTIRYIIGEITPATSLEAGFRNRLTALITAQLHAFEANYAFFRALVDEPTLREPNCTPHNDIQAALADYIEFIASLVVEGQKNHEVRESVNAHHIAFYIFHILQATSMRHLQAPEQSPLGTVDEIAGMLDLLFNGIGSHGV